MCVSCGVVVGSTEYIDMCTIESINFIRMLPKEFGMACLRLNVFYMSMCGFVSACTKQTIHIDDKNLHIIWIISKLSISISHSPIEPLCRMEIQKLVETRKMSLCTTSSGWFEATHTLKHTHTQHAAV